MRVAHQTTIVMLLFCGAAWGVCLAVAGLYALGLGFHADRPDGVLIGLGAAGVSAGNFVFMEVVADRVLTSPPRRLRDATEMIAAGIMVVSLASAGAIWFARTLP
ncbi:MAG: hypothetical protein JNK58_03300 [Phycisphaerae bacterium]|nr:hypothetical protein [Phycisphaerae bacterium]